MRVTTTVSMLFLSGAFLLSGATVTAGECELSCEGACRQEAVMCKQGAALEARADKIACLDAMHGGVLECHGADHEARVGCSELCGPDLRACSKEARAAFKECRGGVREEFKACKAEAAGWAREFKAECAAGKAACMEECQGGVPDGGGLG